MMHPVTVTRSQSRSPEGNMTIASSLVSMWHPSMRTSAQPLMSKPSLLGPNFGVTIRTPFAQTLSQSWKCTVQPPDSVRVTSWMRISLQRRRSSMGLGRRGFSMTYQEPCKDGNQNAWPLPWIVPVPRIVAWRTPSAWIR